MRLNIALSALAGLLVGSWALAAQAADAPAPPAAPIFYCPTPPAAAAKAAACPTPRHVVARRHHWRRRVEVASAAPAGPPDVSASQAFIYRYEEALGGLDARAAHEAWREPPPPMRPPPPRMVMRGPPPPQCPQQCPPRRERPDHGPWVYGQAGPPPAPPQPQPPAPPRTYGWADHGPAVQDRRFAYDEQESAHGWSYREEEGRARTERWSEPPPRGPCPPRPDRGCDGMYAAGAGVWTDGSYGPVYKVAGRDAYGFLVWPGKTPQGDPPN